MHSFDQFKLQIRNQRVKALVKLFFSFNQILTSETEKNPLIFEREIFIYGFLPKIAI